MLVNLGDVAGMDLQVDEPESPDILFEFDPALKISEMVEDIIIKLKKMNAKNESIKAGDFSGLAGNYSSNRPDYSKSVLNALLGMIEVPISSIDFADVGAGTGIWTRMVYSVSKSLNCSEPNEEDNRRYGIRDGEELP